MRVLGIDCGTECTGFGVVEGEGQECRFVAAGAIRTTARSPLSERLLRIADELRRLISVYTPDAVAIEDVFFAANVKSALKLGHVRGVAMLEAARAGLAVSEYSPLEVKQAVVGYGRAEKQQVQHMVKVLLRLAAAPEPYDASDALAVAICHVQTAATRARIARSAAKD